MSKAKAFFKKHFIAVWIITAVAVLSTSIISFAIFTRDNKAKRVVATLPGNGIQFSSNYLTTDSSDILKVVYFGSGSSSLSAYVTICNYAQGSNKPYERDIPYSIAISLVDENKDSVNSSTWTGENPKSIVIYRTPQGSSTETEVYRFDSTHTASGTIPTSSTYNLERGDTSTDTYRIVYNNFDIESPSYSPVFVKMVATPQNISSSSGITTLYGAVSVSKRGTAAVTGWDGDFNDDRTVKNANDYDDFNYVITGTGKGWFAFAWDSSYLEMNKFFKDEIEAISTSGKATKHGTVGDSDVTVTEGTNELLSLTTADKKGWSYIVFYVDSSVKERYSFQLYKKETKSSTDYATFSQLGTYIVKRFTKT